MSEQIKKLRSEILKKRNDLQLDFRKEEERQINEIILQHDKIQKAKVIALFAPYKSEINLWDSIGELWRQGKVLAFPKVEGNVMHFFRCNSKSDLKEGYRGILEPSENTKIVLPAEIETLIAPGSVFSKQGQRIGYGGGFYDKYLSKPSFSAFTMGVGFSFQVVNSWQSEPWDVSLDAVLTIAENDCV